MSNSTARFVVIMGNRIGEFSGAVRKNVHEVQMNRCAYCGKFCDGKHKDTQLQVHHIDQLSQLPPNPTPDEVAAVRRREKAVGLCPPCHRRFDEEAEKGNGYNEVVMREAREREQTRLARRGERQKLRRVS